jgi:hypothetical protein
MPKYVIERNLPGAGKVPPAELALIAARSNATLRELGPDVQWLHTYVTTDKIFCVYIAKNPEIVVEHSRRCGIPCDNIAEVKTIMDPTFGERA